MPTPWIPPSDSDAPRRDRTRLVNLVMGALFALAWAIALIFMATR
ncbi:MAG: hypothetical protein ACOC0P_07635 [Planctomycetota bacterium]